MKPDDKKGAGLMLEESVVMKKRNIFGNLFQKRGSTGGGDEIAVYDPVAPAPIRVYEIENDDGFHVELVADTGVSPKNWLHRRELIELDPMAMPVREVLTFDDSGWTRMQIEHQQRVNAEEAHDTEEIQETHHELPEDIPKEIQKEIIQETPRAVVPKDIHPEVSKEEVEEFAKEFAKEIAKKEPSNKAAKQEKTNKKAQLAVSPVHRQGSTLLATSLGDLIAVFTSPAKHDRPSTKAEAPSAKRATNHGRNAGRQSDTRVQSEITPDTQDFCKNPQCVPNDAPGFERLCRVENHHSNENQGKSRQIPRSDAAAQRANQKRLSGGNGNQVDEREESWQREGAIQDKEFKDEKDKQHKNRVESEVNNKRMKPDSRGKSEGNENKNAQYKSASSNYSKGKESFGKVSKSSMSLVQLANPTTLLNRLTSPTALLAPAEDDFTFAPTGQSESFDWYNGKPTKNTKSAMRAPTTKSGSKRFDRGSSGARHPRLKDSEPVRHYTPQPQRKKQSNELVRSLTTEEDDLAAHLASLEKDQSALSAMVIEIPQKKKKLSPKRTRPYHEGQNESMNQTQPRDYNDWQNYNPKQTRADSEWQNYNPKGTRAGTYNERASGSAKRTRPADYKESKEMRRAHEGQSGNSVPKYINPKYSNGEPIIPSNRESSLRIAGKSQDALNPPATFPGRQQTNKEAVRRFAEDWAQLGDANQVLGQVISAMEGNQSTGTLDEAEMLLASGESNLGEVEKALSTLKKHAKKLGVRESDLLVATVKSYDSAAFSDISFTMGEEFMEVLNSYLRFRK
ncbi:hypothetical protein ACA910_008021 [Epithemia clementina (nom. ined.)]